MTKVKTKMPYCRCKKCSEEIPLNTHKRLTYCTCGTIYVDGCEYYFRIGGNKEDYELLK